MGGNIVDNILVCWYNRFTTKFDRGCGFYDKLKQSGICLSGKGKIAEGWFLSLKECLPGTTQNMCRTVA